MRPRKALPFARKGSMDHSAFNVLFVCPDNSARSVIAEALLNRFGGNRFRGFSAGINPAPGVDPLVLELLRKQNLSTESLKCKSWREFCQSSAPRMHFIISLAETQFQQSFPGDPVLVCWHITDPNAAGPDELSRRQALRGTFRELENRIRLFVLLRHGTPDHWFRPEAMNPTAIAAMRSA